MEVIRLRSIVAIRSLSFADSSTASCSESEDCCLRKDESACDLDYIFFCETKLMIEILSSFLNETFLEPFLIKGDSPPSDGTMSLVSDFDLALTLGFFLSETVDGLTSLEFLLSKL